jgi:hypothetical protein
MRTGTCRTCLGCLFSFLIAALTARADLVIFKDGFTLEGQVKRENEIVTERDAPSIVIPKPGGFWMLEDGPCRLIFNPAQVQDVAKTPTERNTDLRFQRLFPKLDTWRLPTGVPISISPWDERWDRTMRLETPDGKLSIKQHLSTMSPDYLQIVARQYKWTAFLKTREVDPEILVKLLHDHPDFKAKGASTDFNKQFRIFRFLLAAGWEERAMVELDRLTKEFPDKKDKLEAARDAYKRQVAERTVDRLELAHKAGQHDWAQAALAALPRKDLDEKVLARLRALDNIYETLNKNLALARRYLAELPSRVSASPLRELTLAAARTIATELNLDTTDRLEAFVTMAQQAERDSEQAKQSPEQLMALAVTGWLLGNSAADSKVDAMVRLWHTRQMVLEYQNTHDSHSRQAIVAAYEKSEGVAFDELAQVIRHLPPPEPFESVWSGQNSTVLGLLPTPAATFHRVFATLQRFLPAPRYPLRVTLASGIREGADYLVQLPPEYHPGRSYPVLFALHEGGRPPAEALQRWSMLAAQNGYFLVAPEWDRAGAGGYRYSQPEHAAVVDVLRDLRRRFQIDSDRVFLSGYGEGANMAFDVGLSHPDLFAGVLPTSGRTKWFATAYRFNAQYLPFYVVGGDSDGDDSKSNRGLFEQWMPKGFPAILVQYKGRGHESFPLEETRSFDWMSHKKRAPGFPDLGKSSTGGVSGHEFQSTRPTDNHFYWLEGVELKDRFVNDSRRWNNQIPAATLQAAIGASNQVNINCHGFRRIIVWLGLGMIDFDKPVTFFINSQITRANRKVVPSLSTLLEEFYQHGDRQRLFVAKLEFGL